MGDVVRINDYRPNCGDCIYHLPEVSGCSCPGGYRWDMKAARCLSFHRKERHLNLVDLGFSRQGQTTTEEDEP